MKHRNDWENQYVQHINCEPMHVEWGAYENAEQAYQCRRNESGYVEVLDGEWDFLFVKSPDQVPETFYETEYDSTDWDKIPVPGTWEIHGYGEPVYTNKKYPFFCDNETDDCMRKVSIVHEKNGFADLPDYDNTGSPGLGWELNPPFVPQENPTGCYRTEFEIPQSWEEREVFLQFGAVESAFYVWVNGQKVGYSQDSRLPSEFNITSYIHPGKNLLAVQVMKFSDGTYLEDQDYWHMAGIQRSVRLLCKSRIYIRDMKIIPTLDECCENGELAAFCYVNKADGYADYMIRMQVFNAKKEEIIRMEEAVYPQSTMYKKDKYRREAGAARFVTEVARPEKWSADNPVLYTVVFTLISPEGREVDYESSRIGFRRVEIDKRGVILLNGQRLVVRGVNRHEHDCEKGRVMTPEHMEKEIQIIKKLNFNAVRTSHYPNDALWYDLCDEYGLYVVDEANIETHGMDNVLSYDPEWHSAYMDRMVRLVMRDKNHPSVLIWSVGNESCAGMHQAAMKGWVKWYDPYRLVQYESWNPGPLITDIIAPMYPQLPWIDELMADTEDIRPVVMCEYVFARSNSNGNVKEYWDYIKKYPRFQGGFVWDLTDKALLREDGSWGFGGDFEERILDPIPEMCLTGILQPDLTLHPGAYEIMHQQSSVWMEERGSGSYLLHNEYIGKDIADMELQWKILRDGESVQEGNFMIPYLKSGDTCEVILPVGEILMEPEYDYCLNVLILHEKDTIWCQRGDMIREEQFVLQLTQKKEFAVPECRKLSLEAEGDAIRIEGESFSVKMDKAEGRLFDYRYQDRTYIKEMAEENYFRPSTGIDDGCLDQNSFAMEWYAAGYHHLERKVADFCYTVNEDSSAAEFVFTNHITASDADFLIESVMKYTVYGNGTIDICNTIDMKGKMPILPRVGMTLVLENGLEHLNWYGRGPIENYTDRKTAAKLGRYESTVEEQHYDYIVPVECGGKEDVRWLSLGDGSGAGVKIQGEMPFHFDAHHNTVQDYFAAKHQNELERREEIYLNLDAVHSGLGGDTGWTKSILKEYWILPGKYQTKYRISPIL